MCVELAHGVLCGVMLLTLVARSFGDSFGGPEGGPPASLLDLPAYAREELGLTGLSVHASLLAGLSVNDIDRLRDNADKGGCPCLLLIEDTPLPLAGTDREAADGALDRLDRLVRAASRLGCSSIALSLTADGDDSDETRDRLAKRLKPLLQRVERLEVSIMISPGESRGVAGSPESLTALIRKIGGFRVGSFPDLGQAARCGDPAAYLKSTAPYASAVWAPISDVSESGTHDEFDLEPLVDALRTVGFAQNLAIEYVGKNGDPAGHIRRARELFEAALEAEL